VVVRLGDHRIFTGQQRLPAVACAVLGMPGLDRRVDLERVAVGSESAVATLTPESNSVRTGRAGNTRGDKAGYRMLD
jgi:hypothetical protein